MQILEQCEKSLAEARAGDKKHIQRLEKELLNCSQEIGSLFFSLIFIFVTYILTSMGKQIW